MRRSSSPPRNLFNVLVLMALLVPPLAAQRETAEFKVAKDRRTAISYGAVRVGRHTLDELPVGQTWRMGRNDASTFATDVPVSAGDTVIAPGAYRVNVVRDGEQEFALNIDGAGFGLGERSSPDSAGYFRGKYGTAAKPEDALAIAIQPQTKTSDPGQDVEVRIRFGPHTIDVPATLAGVRTQKAAPWTIDEFHLASDLVLKRVDGALLTPVAALRRPDPADNKRVLAFSLVLGKDEARLVPWPDAPKDSFGTIKPPDPARVVTAKVAWETVQAPKPATALAEVEAKKGQPLRFAVAIGDRLARLEIADPAVARK